MASRKTKKQSPKRAAEKVAFATPGEVAPKPRSRRKKSTKRPSPRVKGGRVGQKRLRAVTSLAVVMQNFAGEVQREYRKWITEPPVTESQRRKFGQVFGALADRCGSLQAEYRETHGMLVTEGATAAGPVEDSAGAAFEIAEGAGAGLLLEGLSKSLRAVAGRMEVPYSADTQDKVADDLRTINKYAAQVGEIGRVILQQCRKDQPRKKLSDATEKALANLTEQLRLALDDMLMEMDESSGVGTSTIARVGTAIKRAKGLGNALSGLRNTLEQFVSKHLKDTKTVDISLANNINDLLEQVEWTCTIANNLVEFAERKRNVALTPDASLADGAAQLQKAVHAMQHENDVLQAFITRFREVIESAPYRQFERRRPLPEWDDLDDKEKEVIEAIVQLRDGDPNHEFAFMTQEMIAETLWGSGREFPPSSLYKMLMQLKDTHQIAGNYPAKVSSKQNRTVNHFWINEDAFAKYRPHVLGGARRPG